MAKTINIEAKRSPAMRDQLQKGIYKVINPFVKFLIRIGFTPNAVTTTGLILNIGVAIIFIVGAEEGHRGDLTYVGWAGGLVLFAGLFDMLDGQVARLGGMSSRFGALYDSVLDRYSELIMFLGICYYLIAHHYFLSSLFAFIALIGSMMVSYIRARAEGLGIECKSGLMQRPERVILVGLAGIACGITAHVVGGDYKLFVPGIPFHVFETMSVFTFPITVMAVLTNITAFGRLRESRKALEAKEASEAAQSRKPVSVVLLLLVALASFALPGQLRAQNGQQVDEAASFPVPKGIKEQMFYVQRTPNTNTIVYELRRKEDGELDEDNPIHVFWIRYTEEGQRKELNFIQRKFAYGLKVKKLDKDKYDLRFVAYDKRQLLLIKTTDGKYYVFAQINNKRSVLKRIFIKIDGGTFWHPNVIYIELKGYDAETGLENIERIKP